MSYVPQRLHHGSPERTPPSAFLSPQHGEDELHFDFDISSPESPADHEEDYGGDSVSFGRCHHHLDHSHCSSTVVDDAPKSVGNHNNGLHDSNCCRPTAEEESGCISSVSSVITEQDNDDDDDEDGHSDALCRFSPVEWPDAEFPSCPWSPQPPVIVTAQPTPSGHLSTVAPNGLSDGSGCTSPAIPKLGTIVEQVTLEESDENATPPWDDPAVVDLEGGRVAENGLVTSEAEWIGQGVVVEGGHDPESGLSSCTDSDAPMNSSSDDGVGDGPEPTAVHCADTEETDETNDRDGSGDRPDLKADVDDSHGRDPSEDDEVSEQSVSFCRVCVSPPPAFLHLGDEGSAKLPNDESESTGDCDRHEPAEKSPGRLMVDVNLSPLNEGDSNEANSPTPNDDDFPQRVRRSSSLKTGKTPPGTPNRKKIVRFADAMGLDLEAVKTVFLDDLPVVPSSAYVDLHDGAYLGSDDDAAVGGLTIYNSNLSRGHLPPFGLAKPRSCIIPVFPQPGSLSDFIDRVRRQSVCLESAVVTGDFNICLVVRVLNLHFHKHVVVRYTYDDWATVHDQVAEYVADSHDSFSDKFSTVINASRLQIGDRLLFALRYLTEGSEFWDNNHGQNYCFQCFVEQQYQPSPPDDSWIHFL